MNEEAIYELLASLGPGVYPVALPLSAAFPAITYMVVYDGVEQCMAYEVTGREKRYQVDVWAESYAEAKEIARQAVATLAENRCYDISVSDAFVDDAAIYRQIIDFKTRS